MKFSTLILGGLTATLSLSSNVFPANAQSALQWLQQIPGRYNSQISTGRLSVQGTTEFFLSHTGALIGTYSIQQDGKIDLGVLHDCEATASLKLRCIWSDRFGSGDLNLTFSRSANQFSGQGHETPLSGTEVVRAHPPFGLFPNSKIQDPVGPLNLNSALSLEPKT